MKGSSQRNEWARVGSIPRVVAIIVLLVTVTEISSGNPNSASPSNAVSVSILGLLGVIPAFDQMFLFGGPFFPSMTVTYDRAIIDHLVFSASLSYFHANIFMPGDFFNAWAEIDWNSDRLGLDGWFIGIAAAAEADYYRDETPANADQFPPTYMFDHFGLSVGRRQTIGHHFFEKGELGGTFPVGANDSAAIMAQLAFGYSF